MVTWSQNALHALDQVLVEQGVENNRFLVPVTGDALLLLDRSRQHEISDVIVAREIVRADLSRQMEAFDVINQVRDARKAKGDIYE